jgi:NADH:ubiquinone oxidoreductase subunit F (NADH-binding)
MVFTVCGDVRREGAFELPLGTPLRSLVEELAGGPPEGRRVKAIFPGASDTVITAEELDVPMDFDSMRQDPQRGASVTSLPGLPPKLRPVPPARDDPAQGAFLRGSLVDS